VLALAAGLAGAGAEPRSEPAIKSETETAPAAATGAEPPKASADRARAVLDAHCAECREDGALLDLDALAEDPRLVVPRRPDASRLYQRLLARQVPAASGNGKPSGKTDAPAVPVVPGPTAAEVESVRDWIESLPPRDEACRDRAAITAGDVEDLIERWTKAVGTAEAADTRFVSLAHLWNACVPAARLKALREAAVHLLAALSRHDKPLEVETLGEESAILAFRVSEFGPADRKPDLLTAPSPQVLSDELIPADWLAAEALNHAEALGLRLDGATQQAVAGLARFRTRDVDLVRAAAERGVPPRDLTRRLAELDGDLVEPAQRLTRAALSRARWSELARVLDGDAGPETVTRQPPPAADEIDVLLWPEQPDYKPRDLVTLNVRVSKACHLTLIDIDRSGKALVLFPSEFEPDNLIAPAVTVRIPGRDAGYQLRFDESGEEQFVAVCQRRSRRLAGVDYDFERQRFAILGDWRTFVRTAPDREKAIEAREAAEAARRKRRGRAGASETAPPAIDAAGPAVEGRAAITVVIEPGGAP
jgi:hypothetical protein